ncbi:MAG: undecaprenyl-diphosphate phosphatase [Candidatus Yanofskybacteria bacterium]|nr:undecaprenyl-diphosphate phosphatase [Candidatus Yanofskybacteria bacterium]
MNYFHAIILGIIEGVTEFLPISSTGHLVVAGRLLNLPSGDFLRTFDIAIQLGAILAVLTLYGASLLRSRKLLSRVIVAFIPTGVLGLTLYPFVKRLLAAPAVTLWSLGLGGVLLIVFERWYAEPADAHEDLSTMPYRTALLVGLSQSVAMIPGVSRAAATICGGLMLGMSRRAIIEFSFLLALPTMAAATGLELISSASLFTQSQFGLLAVGFVVSWVVAVIAIRWLLRFVRTHDFTLFGVYRLIAAVAFWRLLF